MEPCATVYPKGKIMNSHLPECIVPDFDNERWICICNHLRACEERVFEAAYQAGKSYGLTVNGYTRGLNAAREAVEAMDLHGCTNRWLLNCNCVGPKVISALDALKEKQ